MRKLFFLALITISLSSFAQIPNIWFPATGTDTYSTNIPNFGTNYTNKIAFVKFTNTNTGASTININSLGAVALRMWDGDSWEALTASQISTTTVYRLSHTGSYFTMIGASSGGGTWGSITGTLSDQTDLQTALNAKQNTLTLGNLTTPTTGVSITGGTGAVVGSGTAISIQNATTSQSGLLTNTDWNTFNNKQAALVSGTNIKTVSGTSLLGSGDLGVIGSSYGGAGSVNGILKANGSGVVSAAVAGTDYLSTSNVSGTSNQIAYFSGSNTVNSLSTATYPSLTELSYVKGVTSSIQTQINLKQDADVFNDVFYVEDYGAIGDSNGTTGSGTNNTTALQNAINAAISNGGGIVMLGKGIYRFLTTTLTTTGSNIVIKGLGQGVSTLFWDDNTTSNSRSIDITGEFSGVENLTLQMRRTLVSTVGIRLFASNTWVKNCEVKDANSFAIYTRDASNVVISDNYVHESSADAIHASINVSKVLIKKNVIYNCADDGIGIGYEGSASQISIIDNVIEQTSAGIAVYGYSTVAGTALVTDILIEDNNIKNTWLGGISLRAINNIGSISRVSILSNHIRDAGQWTPASSVNMRGDGVAAGIIIDQQNSSSDLISGVLVSGNFISNPRNNGISVGQSSGTQGIIGNLSFIGNTISGLTTTGGQGAAAGSGGGDSFTPTNTGYAAIVITAPNRVTGTMIEVAGNTINSVVSSYVTVTSTSTGFYTVKNNTASYGNGGAAASFAYVFTGTTISLLFSNNIAANAQNAFTAAFDIPVTVAFISNHTANSVNTNGTTTNNIETWNDGTTTVWSIADGGILTATSARLSTGQGTDVASVAGAITLTNGNVFEITGTNAITLIANTNWQNGSEITLLFTSTASLTDGTANSGSNIGMELNGNANFSATADDTITLVLSEIGGTQRWREVSRSVN